MSVQTRQQKRLHDYFILDIGTIFMEYSFTLFYFSFEKIVYCHWQMIHLFCGTIY